MVTMRFLPPRAAVLDSTPETRDRAIDVARLVSLLVVLFGHCVLLLATVTPSGVWVGNTLGAQPSLQPITWLLQVMPLFFLAGAASSAYGLKPGTPWGGWLFGRAQRLARPVFWYLAFWSLALGATRVLLGESSAARLGGESVALLWFIGVYLLVLPFVPFLMRCGTAALAGVVVALLAASALVDGARLASGAIEWGFPNFLIVWLIPVVIGVAYARRQIRTRFALVIAAVAFAAALAAVVLGPYDVPLVVTGTETFSNTTPPTFLLGLHCVWVSLLFVAAAPAIGRWARIPRGWYPIAVGNSGAMTLYLWHIPAIAVAAFALHAVGIDAVDPAQAGFWGLMALRAMVFAVVMFALFVLLSPLEHRRLPWWDARVTIRGVRGAGAGVLVCVAGAAALLMAKEGLGSATGWSALAVFVVTMVAARALAGATAPRDALRDAASAPGLTRPGAQAGGSAGAA
ncbi:MULTISPECIES: acyltransferase family protein [Tsukamurella]|uniref:Acyltransferase n=2 Tax=Tsukamurella TaxID=2060 RepID=A0A5C5RXJ4_9ACTN|nr:MULTISPECIES: acyltransferase [Tsukamurella]NMD57281.1 acyltransferase [Tsukamurella columbiensis]TWS27809.1 acyltransferase [Tsukamurella conjunctivitidis]